MSVPKLSHLEIFPEIRILTSGSTTQITPLTNPAVLIVHDLQDPRFILGLF